ncbi:MAG: NAD(P)/FAD-dependent oxidoreductase [Treponema sp.]|jgi:flavin-dependent dehydrogenase|nr:NAD(P)/FAD-dependent oxidoreductase [Treponema sp.]
MKRDVDVLVIGGCTAGLYFAGLMARRGFRTLVCDCSTQENLGRSYDVIHIGREYFSRFGLPEPGPGDSDYVATFRRSIFHSALDKWPKNNRVEVLVLRRVGFIRRLADWAREQGAETLYGTAFTEPLFENGRLSGALFRGEAGDIQINARLTADASGISAVLRTRLPGGDGVENFVTGDRDRFYVTLRYVRLKHPEKDRVEVTTTWPYYKTWIAPREESDGAIFGVGANLSFDYADRCFNRFAGKVRLPEYELDRIEQSSTPYRRPPYSFVSEGFVVLGDAACLTNPWSGEGVPYAWLLCSIAAEEFGKAMQDGAYPVQDAVWGVNVRYARAQGALFAQNLAMLSGAVSCTPEENDYEFEKGIIFEDDAEKGKGNLVLKLLKGFLSGRLSWKSLSCLAAAAGNGAKIYKHYMAYPESPRGLADWARKADALWAKTRSMADIAEADLAGMEAAEAASG